MIVVLNITKYKGIALPMGFSSMMFFYIYLFFFKPKNSFCKLMGTGKNGTFDIVPDLGQWSFLSTWASEKDYYEFYNKSFIKKYTSLFGYQNFAFFLSPVKVHGLWDGIQPFEESNEKFKENENIAVLTRATIRLSKLIAFWSNVPKSSESLDQSPGFKYSLGVGEVPFIKQSTFSIWESEAEMINFAYKSHQHKKVILKTKKDNWYSEELFARFKLIKVEGIVLNHLEIK